MKGTSTIDKYLQRHQVDGALLPERASKPDIIVVIPCYDEPAILETLNLLKEAQLCDFVVEVVVVVNSGEHTPVAIVEQNRKTYNSLLDEAKIWDANISLSPILIENVRRKHAGVGYARKVGMDLALWRFREASNTSGIIASLDADTRVEVNYFAELNKKFQSFPKLYGTLLNFAHDIEGVHYSSEVYEGIMHYELHLRYVNQALKMSTYPYVHHTIGSAFAVRASAYAAHGGMNRRQGGEDFYFLHKLFPHGEFAEINSTTVHPSSRPSGRVPFGTGPQVNVYLSTKEMLTYNINAFLDLKAFVEQVPLLYNKAVKFSESMQAFLETIAYEESLEEIRRNSATQASFEKRFYAYFDAFKVVKFLNFSHQSFFCKTDVVIAAQRLLILKGYDANAEVRELLLTYRKIEGK